MGLGERLMETDGSGRMIHGQLMVQGEGLMGNE